MTLDGLGVDQKLSIMTVLNEQNCECGCGKGSLAFCVKSDPGCPVSPRISKEVISRAKQGQGIAALRAYVQAEVKSKPGAPAAGPAPSEKVDVDVGSAPTKGPKSAKVTIVTFSDFQCPFCSRVNPTMEEIEKTYKDKVRIAFKHLPLSFHDKAQGAAEASMAAHAQGKFWEMHDKLFANQGALDRASLDGYAKDLGLNVAQFKAALDSGKYADYVKQDAAQASRIGATGTPAFYINGKKLSGAQPFAAFKTEIDAALAE
jgi:protein-disulfide isomerase